jgi:hypothetical protein
MHTVSFFNELELVEKLGTSSRTSHRDTPRIRGLMQIIELPKTM